MTPIKTLFHSEWIDVLQETQHDYVFASRKNKNSVAILCVRKIDNDYEYLIHYQTLIGANLNAIDALYPCPITGTLEMDKSILTVCHNEMYEEGGFIVPKDLQPLAKMDVVSTTQMNEIVHVFVFDVTGLVQQTPTTDGSYYEKISYNKWVNQIQFNEILSSSLCLSTLYVAKQLFEKYLKEQKNEN